jgi:hypothetical protein
MAMPAGRTSPKHSFLRIILCYFILFYFVLFYFILFLVPASVQRLCTKPECPETRTVLHDRSLGLEKISCS